MRIQQTLEKYVPLISNMILPAVIYAVSLMLFLIKEPFEIQTNIFLHYFFYFVSFAGLLIMLNFNINRHMFFMIGNLLCYVLINCLKREYGAVFRQSLWFDYLIILIPLNLILIYLYGSFRFISSKSLRFIMIILFEYGIVETLVKYNINIMVSVYDINIIAFTLFFVFVAVFLIKSIKENNLYNYTTLYSTISVISGICFSNTTTGMILFFAGAQFTMLIDLIFTLTYNYFYDETTGFYSRNSYLIKSKSFPFKYNLGIISIDNYDKLLTAFGYKKQRVLTNLIAEVVQDLTSEEVVFRYAADQFVILYKDKDNKEAYTHLDNIRRVIAGLSFSCSPKGQPIKLTVSCSLAEKKRSDAGAIDVLVRADKAMQKTLKFSHNVTSRG